MKNIFNHPFKMNLILSSVISLSLTLSVFAKSGSSPQKSQTAVIETTLGKINLKLFQETAPKTVENFIGLATGKKVWTDPRTEKKVIGKSLYSGTIFHRVIPDFMIQGGDPLGNGTSGPGYQFEDEVNSALQFDRPGILAMANAGPNTNGSQFFITVKPTPWLNGKHTIFGEVVSEADLEIVKKISTVETQPGDVPKKPITIQKIRIVSSSKKLKKS